MTPKLTLNIGLRYEYQSPYVEQNNRVANFVINLVVGPRMAQGKLQMSMFASNYRNAPVTKRGATLRGTGGKSQPHT